MGTSCETFELSASPGGIGMIGKLVQLRFVYFIV